MWKWVLASLAALLILVVALAIYLSNEIYLRHDHETVVAERFAVPLPAATVREDIEYLLATLDRIHPAFEAVGGASYTSRALELAANLDGAKTRKEIYRHFAPLNSLLVDGHTSLRLPAEEFDAYQENGGRLVPFTVNLVSGGLVIDRVLIDDPGIRPGDGVEDINGVSAVTLAGFSLASQSGESAALRSAYAQRSFASDLWAAGVESPFRIGISRDGRRWQFDHEGLAGPDYRARRDGGATGNNGFRELEDGVGLLTFNHMPPADADFREFLRATFRSIRDRGVEALILDIRDNGGGDSRAGDALMAYLSPLDLPAIEYVEVKVTDEIKAYYDTLLPRGFRWIPLHRFVEVLGKIRSTPSGETFRLYPDATQPVPLEDQPKDAFSGRLVVLIGPRTYSSAVIFAAPLKHFGRATFIGQETGEPLIFFGENYYFDLPGSKLEAQVSHKKFVLVGASDEVTGIVPDYVIANDGTDALAMAIRILGESSGDP